MGVASEATVLIALTSCSYLTSGGPSSPYVSSSLSSTSAYLSQSTFCVLGITFFSLVSALLGFLHSTNMGMWSEERFWSHDQVVLSASAAASIVRSGALVAWQPFRLAYQVPFPSFKLARVQSAIIFTRASPKASSSEFSPHDGWCALKSPLHSTSRPVGSLSGSSVTLPTCSGAPARSVGM